MSYLSDLVVARCKDLGDPEAAKFFGVSERLVGQWKLGSKPVSLSAVEKVFDLSELLKARPSVEAEWASKDTCVLLPFYKTTNPKTLQCLLGIWDRTKMTGVVRDGDAQVHFTRDRLADAFIDLGLENSIWLDDDMLFPFGQAAWYNQVTKLNLPEQYAGLHAFNRLRSHGKEIVGALYRQRDVEGKFCFAEALNDGAVNREITLQTPRNELRETAFVGTGGPLLVHRDVFLDIRKRFPQLAPKSPKESWHYFSAADDGLNLPIESGEDVIFCTRARAAGHSVFVDLGLRSGHFGGAIY